MDSFEIELKQGFLEEAEQLINDAEQCFLSLETNPNDTAILEKIFRLAHNLKGSSKAVGFSDLGLFTHEFENLLLKLKKGDISASTPVVNLLLKCNDHLKNTIAALKADVSAVVDHSAITAEVQSAINGELNSATPEQPTQNEETFSASEVELLKANEEMAQIAADTHAVADVSTEPSSAADNSIAAAPPVSMPTPAVAPATQPSANAPAAAAQPQTTKVEQKADESIRVSLNRLEKLINYVGEMVILQAVLREQSYGSNPILLRKTVHQLGKVGKEIQDISMSLRMVPLKQTFQKMQRIVRDTSNLLGKKVNLALSGEETELDKTVLEALGDPLVHLIRNAVDHGIESNEKRIAAGKNESGTVLLSAYHQGGKLVIEVKDDGGGIDPDRLIAKAREKGILKPGQTLTREQGINLIFHAGFSTKAEVTEVSGRGVGMDVVRTNIEALQGEIQVKTELGKGTTFLIILPLTLAIIDAMVVALDKQRFVIPLAHVHESYRAAANDVKRISGVGEILLLRGENLPLYRLSHLVGYKREEKAATEGIALISRVGESPFAILVDDILGQHQVVIKKLGLEAQHLKGFSGSAILGDGRPSLILELSELIQGSANAPFKADTNRRVAV